ncbi:hypothetical protein [Rickettsia endosymbiont of Rhinocyllus conicus]|uniref:hypothetical protein n=1 Tax=Rickettsia endosymbiont of Rhinocyllus conicus TaxID=3066252 RepID=UPI003133537D
MVEKFDAKKAGKIIKNIKNEKVNPFFNKTTGSKTYTSSEQKSTIPNALKNKAKKGYEQALKIEAKAKDAGVKLDKDAKIKDRYTQATKKDNFNKHQSDQAYAKNQQAHKDFVSGKTAAAQKQRRDDYRGR